MKITNDIYYVGVNDHQIDLFEGQYKVQNGMSYNSYIIMDDKIAVLDSVDINFTEEWLDNISTVLKDRIPDYFIISHMEPDHSANIQNFLKRYPDTIVVGNANTFKMLGQFFEFDSEIRKMIVKENESLSLGNHELTFIMAPMVHWPEVMVSYDKKDKVLFSADAFGKFGANDVEEEWACEARRYYFGIVGKYGAQVQSLIKKISNLDIQIICALHGPVLKENINEYIHYYQLWSTYEPESKGVVIAYASLYGNTKAAACFLKEELKKRDISAVLIDLARYDMHEAVEEAFKYNQLVLVSPTYNADIFPCVKQFIHCLVERNYQNRTIGFIENGSWAPVANKVMKKMLENCKNIRFIETEVSIKSSMKENDKQHILLLAKELIDKVSFI